MKDMNSSYGLRDALNEYDGALKMAESFVVGMIKSEAAAFAAKLGLDLSNPKDEVKATALAGSLVAASLCNAVITNYAAVCSMEPNLGSKALVSLAETVLNSAKKHAPAVDLVSAMMAAESEEADDADEFDSVDDDEEADVCGCSARRAERDAALKASMSSQNQEATANVPAGATKIEGKTGNSDIDKLIAELSAIPGMSVKAYRI